MKVEELYIYPVKSCKGIRVQQCVPTRTGFAWDRQWMVVAEPSGRFFTQRTMPKMALVEVALPPEVLAAAEWGDPPPDAALHVSAPGMPQPLQVPLQGAAERTTRKVTVWEWTGPALDEGDDAAAWFSQYLGKPARLVRMAGSDVAQRQCDAAWARGHHTAFADGFPYLLATQESLEDLDARMGATPAATAAAAALSSTTSSMPPDPSLSSSSTPLLPMDRFRPNLVVSGCQAWEEDMWREVAIHPAGGGDPLAAAVVKPCSRCTVPTVDQGTGRMGGPDAEPNATMKGFRSGEHLGWSDGSKWRSYMFFGVNMAIAAGGPQPRIKVSVGDALQVVSRRQGWSPSGTAS